MKQNTFIEPVGSIPMTTDLPTGTNDSYDVVGRGGKVRHTGNFSPNNPYLAQLQVATSNQDKDALYELAVQWEADYANLNEQRAYNRQVLEEQRQYDSPEAQVARQRAAGINPDLAGTGSSGTSSGSSAQMQLPAMADQSGQTKFSNAYDNTSLVFEGINTAANVVSSFAGGFGTIMESIDKLKTLPSRISMHEAQAGLMQAEANEINEMLPGKKEGQKLGNAGQSLYNIGKGIENSSAILQQLAGFSQLISPDTADFAPHLKALGVAEENIAPYTDIIKQMHANPKMRDQYAKASVSARWSEAENTQYSTDLIGRMVSSSIKIQQQEQQFAEDYNTVQNRVQAILAADPQYAQDTADLVITDTAHSLDQQAFAIQQFERDVEVYGQNIEDIAWSIKRSQATIQDIYNKAGKEKRELSPVEKATIEDLQTTIRQQRVLGSQQVQQLYGLEKHANRLKFYSEDRIKTSTGESEPLTSLQRHNIESRIVFDDVLTDVKTGTELALDVAGRVISTLGIAAATRGTQRTIRSSYQRKPTTPKVDYVAPKQQEQPNFNFTF